MITQTQPAVLDPICGRRLLSKQNGLSYTYIGQEYRFCSQGCYDLFVRSPEYYITLVAHDKRGHCGLHAPPQKRAPTIRWISIN